MKYKFRRPKSFQKNKVRYLNRFRPSRDRLIIDASSFGHTKPGMKIVRNQSGFKKALRSKHSFIYNKTKGWIVFNENGNNPGYGRGGHIARLPRRSKLKLSQVRFKNPLPFNDPETSESLPLTTDPISPDPSITDQTTSVPTTADPSASETSTTEPSTAEPDSTTPSTPGLDLTPADDQVSQPLWYDPEVQTIFPGGPQRQWILEKNHSGVLQRAGEVDRFAISPSSGSVLSLSLTSDPNTWPLVRIINSDGKLIADATAFDDQSASTRGFRTNGEDLFAEVYSQDTFTGNYELTTTVWETQHPLLKRPETLSILLDEESLLSGDRFSSKYLYVNNGLIYVSFGNGINPQLKGWWEEVLASTDALIEPEFMVVPSSDPRTQLSLNQTAEESISGAAGHYTSSFQYSKLEDESTYDYHRSETLAEITLSEGVYSHASRFANSREAGWKSTAFHELGHALGMEHPHDFSDGDGDDVIGTNGTVMSYVLEQDENGDPGFTELDIQALQLIYGPETGRTTPSPIADLPLLINSRVFDLDRRWKAPQLTAAWVGNSQITEPATGTVLKTFQLTRSDGDLSSAARIWLDFEVDSELKVWDSMLGFSEGFHDVVIAGNSATFQPGEATTTFELPVLAGTHTEGDEWLEITVRPEDPSYFSAVPSSPARLTIMDS